MPIHVIFCFVNFVSATLLKATILSNFLIMRSKVALAGSGGVSIDVYA